MKHFKMPRNQILRENETAHAPPLNSSPNPKSRSGTPNRKNKSASKENAPPPASSDLNVMYSPAAAAKLRNPLPPRPPLKRKLCAEPAMVAGAVESGAADSGVKVIVRVRPPTNDEGDSGNVVQKLTDDSLSIAGQIFTFDSIADIESRQIDVFQMIGAPLIENCLAGFNSSVFAYGQTGSGKTYTIWGASNAMLGEDQQGLAPRVFHKLFERIDEEQVKQADKKLVYMCRCSFLEIYNEQITDLLDPCQKNLQIREDVKSGVYVENLKEECVTSMKDVSQLLIKGLSNRRTGSTSVNAESSRSHCVFTCVVESHSKSVTDGLSSVKISRINFVDLAGSERQKQTGAAGERLKEAGNINRSLSQLGNLINILAEVSQTGKQRHIPYRDSKLTFLLQESLGGNAKMAMICAISPALSCKSETLSTLRFAQRAKAIKNKAVVNEVIQDDVHVLREVIRQLKDELHKMKSNTSPTDQTGAYATGWSARRSLNLLKFSLNRPMALPHLDDDGDAEMEIVSDEEGEQDKSVPEPPNLQPDPSEEGTINISKNTVSGEQGYDDIDVDMEDEAFETVEKEKAKEKSSKILENLSTEVTPEKPTNCVEDTTNLNLSIVPSDDVLPILKSPLPSVSPKLNNSRKSASKSNLEAAHLSFSKTFNSVLNSLSSRKNCLASNDDLAATLHRGMEIIKSQQHLSPVNGRSSFRFSCMAVPSMPVVKVDAGVQTAFDGEEEVPEKGIGETVCSVCKARNYVQEVTDTDEKQNMMQLVPSNGVPQVPKAVEKVLAGAIRREMALEEMCAKHNSEIKQLNRLVQQYKHERECNAIIGRTREDKISRLESLMDGILPTEEFMEDELLSLTHEHKILQERYNNHPDVLTTKIELKRVQHELEKYQNFFDLGERDVLLEEIQDLRTQLQFYVDSSPNKTPKKHSTPDSHPISESTAESRLQLERTQWTEQESKWISLVEELRSELESQRILSQNQSRELDTEKKCSEELKEAMRMAMEGHARMLEQYAELEEKHIHLLTRHRNIQEGINDVKKAATKAGVRGAESRFINALAAEISALKAEREKERQFFRDENKGLQAQLRDTAEAVQAAGELLVRLKEAEEAAATAEKRARIAEKETEMAYKEIDKMNKLITAPHTRREEEIAPETQTLDENQQWQEELAPSYDVEEEPSWFSGYDRCNI